MSNTVTTNIRMVEVKGNIYLDAVDLINSLKAADYDRLARELEQMLATRPTRKRGLLG